MTTNRPKIILFYEVWDGSEYYGKSTSRSNIDTFLEEHKDQKYTIREAFRYG